MAVDPDPAMPGGRFVIKSISAGTGLAALSACLTVLFLCGRAVMDIGGSCASGGPYVVARPCPDGVAWLAPVSIVGGLVALGWYGIAGIGLPGPKWMLLAWPALFLSLGWSFWEYGFDPPGESSDISAGWLICAVMFTLMGGAALLVLKIGEARRAMFWADATRSVVGAGAADGRGGGGRLDIGTFGAVYGQAVPEWGKTTLDRVAPGRRPRPPRAPGAPRSGGNGSDLSTDLVADLQRLADLHRSGALTDDEFAAAKRHRLSS